MVTVAIAPFPLNAGQERKGTTHPPESSPVPGLAHSSRRSSQGHDNADDQDPCQSCRMSYPRQESSTDRALGSAGVFWSVFQPELGDRYTLSLMLLTARMPES